MRVVDRCVMRGGVRGVRELAREHDRGYTHVGAPSLDGAVAETGFQAASKPPERHEARWMHAGWCMPGRNLSLKDC